MQQGPPQDLALPLLIADQQLGLSHSGCGELDKGGKRLLPKELYEFTSTYQLKLRETYMAGF